MANPWAEGEFYREGKRHFLTGRPVVRARGYVALYRYVAEVDIVFVLALRSQQEAGRHSARVVSNR